MKRITSLSDLLMEELSDLLNAENLLAGALPKMAEASQLSTLKQELEDFLVVTKEQADRLEDIFDNISQNPHYAVYRGVEVFIKEIEHVINTTEKSAARDTVVIDITQRAIQKVVSIYKTAREHAADLGHTRILEILGKSLDEKRAMNLHLSELAQSLINVQATDPNAAGQESGFYVPEGKFVRKSPKKKNKNTDVSRYIEEGNPNLEEPKEPRDFPNN